MIDKLPFDIDAVMAELRIAVAEMPAPSMFQLADEGFASPFQQLVSCIVSIRTLEEVSLPTARELLTAAPDAAAMAALPVKRIERMILRSSFSERKATQIHAIARETVERFGGELPCDADTMLGFSGVGPKCANLAVGVACVRLGKPFRALGGAEGGRVIPVDIHVHRIANRWGIVATKTPEQTTIALEAVLPQRYDVEINERLVPFGKFVCTGIRPKCSTCPLLRWCRQVGVTSHR